jgi:ABC-2 type transport system permease protein
VSRALTAQARAETTLSLRRGESVLLTLGIPVGLLVFFSSVDVLPIDADEPIAFLAPGVLALAVMSTAMVNLAISTGFERQYLVLKRLGATPLGRGRLLGAKTIAVGLLLVVQVVVLTVVSLVLGWEPDAAGIPLALAGAVLATVAFAGLGLWMAGTLRGEMTLALANGLYLLLLLLGGMVIPLDELPTAVQNLAGLLPAAALADVMVGALTPGGDIATQSWVVLVVWAAATPAAAIRWFRWE